MKPNSNAPLAVDPDGTPLSLPDDAARWRIKRQTGGRPRQVLGPDQQPLEIDLDATPEDLLATLGPGAYRLEAVDGDGEPIDCIATWAVGDDPTGKETGSAPTQARTWTTPSRNASDLRAALDANTQMARTMSDAVRVLAEAQADWTKGLAVARAIPRNAKNPPAPWPAVAPIAAPPHSAEHDDSEPEQEGWLGAVSGFVDAVGKENLPHLMQVLPDLAGTIIDRIRAPKPTAAPAPAPAAAQASTSTEDAA